MGNKWPDQSQFIDYLHRYDHIPDPVTIKHLVLGMSMTEDAAESFLRYYNWVLGENIMPQKEVEDMRKYQEQDLLRKQVGSILEERIATSDFSVQSICKVQAVIRGKLQRRRISKRLEIHLRDLADQRMKDVEHSQQHLGNCIHDITNAFSNMEERLARLKIA